MRKSLMVFAVLAACLVHAEDSFLYWFFDDPDIFLTKERDVSVKAGDLFLSRDGQIYDANMVRVAATDSAGNKYYLESGDAEVGFIDGMGIPDEQNAWRVVENYARIPVAANGLPDPSLSFMFEIGNATLDAGDNIVDWIVLAVSETKEFSSLNQFIVPVAQTLHGRTPYGAVYFIPEPSSGLLLLVGAGLLSLRRRRRAV